MRKVILLLIFSFSLAFQLKGQKLNSYQTWLDYVHNHKLGGNWIYFSDYGFRWSDLRDNGYWRLNVRPSIEYRTSARQSFKTGIGIFYKNNVSNNNTLEIRPWQGYQLKWPTFGRFRFFNYARLEERLVDDVQSSNSSFTFKFRYKLGVDVPINNPTIAVGTFYARLSYEIFADLVLVNQDVSSDRNRFELGLGYRYSKNLRFRMLYVQQTIKNHIESGANQTDHVVRISVIQNFGFD